MEVKTTELISALEKVRPGLSKKDIIDTTSHFLFTGQEVLTYNDRITIAYPFKTDFQCTVQGLEFYKILSGIKVDKDKTNMVSLELSGNTIQIKAKGTKASLAVTFDNTLVEIFKELNLADIVWKDLPKGFKDAVSYCLFSASKDARTGALNCICVDGANVISSDNVRISKVSLSSQMDPFLLPLSSANAFVNFEMTQYNVDERSDQTWVHFIDGNGVTFSSRLGLGDPPDVADYFTFPDCDEIVIPKEVKEPLESILIMTEGNTLLDRDVKITINDGVFSIIAEKTGVGWVEKSIEMPSYTGEKIEFMIHPIFLSQILEKVSAMKLHEDRALFTAGNFSHIMALPIKD